MKTIRTTFAVTLMALGIASSAATDSKAAKSNPATAAALADIEKTLGFVPSFFKEIPEQTLPGAWEEMKGLQMNPSTALPTKVKELIGLGVSAQIPCTYCIEAHTEFAKLNGATQAEIGEAVAMAALSRHWSTFLNGIQTDEVKFRVEISKLIEHAKKAGENKAAPPAPVEVVDGQTALKDISQSFGFVPEFLKRFPDAGRAGAWKGMRDVEMNPQTAIPGKYKSLIGLAVSSQVPCKFCIIADTEFSKLEGATDAEITEAIAMAAFTRHMSTLLNGMQVDKARFNTDLKRLVKNAKAAAAKEKKTTQAAAAE